MPQVKEGDRIELRVENAHRIKFGSGKWIIQ
jgi:hypothetical protein